MPRYPSLFQINTRAFRLLQVLRQTPVPRLAALASPSIWSTCRCDIVPLSVKRKAGVPETDWVARAIGGGPGPTRREGAGEASPTGETPVSGC